MLPVPDAKPVLKRKTKASPEGEAFGHITIEALGILSSTFPTPTPPLMPAEVRKPD